MDEPLDAFDVECVYRMIALACAAMITDKGKDHTHVMAVADSFMDYIDPFAADDDEPEITLKLEKKPK